MKVKRSKKAIDRERQHKLQRRAELILLHAEAQRLQNYFGDKYYVTKSKLKEASKMKHSARLRQII